MTVLRSAARIFVIALAALLATGAWPASAARGADDSNIPGVPLPTGVVTGTLGGPVYDHVYAIDVPTNSLILLSLSGDDGTDFDLYLFGRGATTVYSTVGLVASSTGLTSSEAITYASPGGGRYYIDLNGATDIEGHFRLAVSIARDTAAPTAAVKLNGSSPATRNETVTVTVVATDDLSGIDSMQVSLDGVAWGPWVAYAPAFLWNFDGPDGPRAFWARVRDRAGNVSAPAHATITLDRTAPQVVKRDPGPDGTAIGLQPTFAVTFDEPIDPSSWLDHGLIVQQSDAGVVQGTYRWNADTTTGTFVPAVVFGAGERVLIAVGGVVDLAGNPVAALGTWSATVLRTHRATVGAVPAVTGAGGATRISGRIDPPVLADTWLESSLGTSNTWTRVRALSLDANGGFAVVITVTVTTSFRVKTASTAVDAASTSGTVRVIARRGVNFVGAGSVGAQNGVVGKTYVLRASLVPSLPDASLTLMVSRYDSAKQAWVASAKVGLSSIRGAATFSWHPTLRGHYRMYLVAAPTALYGSGVSPVRAWSIQ